jgi:hypothetical protein
LAGECLDLGCLVFLLFYKLFDVSSFFLVIKPPDLD